MSESFVALAVELPDMEAIYPILESGSQAGRQSAFLAYVNEQFDSEYEEDLAIEDISLDGGWVVVDYQCSTELCNEITHVLFEGLAEQEGKRMAALEYNSRIGVYTIMVPGYDEAEYVDECFGDFDGRMHELEEVMDRRDQLMHVLELMETEPVASALREYLGEEDQAADEEVEEIPEDSDIGEHADSPPKEEPEAGDSSALMKQLKLAMAENDEDRINDLMELVQKRSNDG